MTPDQDESALRALEVDVAAAVATAEEALSLARAAANQPDDSILDEHERAPDAVKAPVEFYHPWRIVIKVVPAEDGGTPTYQWSVVNEADPEGGTAGSILLPDGTEVDITSPDWADFADDVDIYLQLSLAPGSGNQSGTFQTDAPTPAPMDNPALLPYHVGQILFDDLTIVQRLSDDIDFQGRIIPAMVAGYDKTTGQFLAHDSTPVLKWISPKPCGGS